ncbi:hypothetical protein [Chiayiivirga flava]|uniref:Uncharacterized protein n=1 Tax=Chiayiivirga flava TaxID=659595 RepID=A0A7W8FYT6_9GAMM|nr:hypothetical protein [Chiayiivirga flava]MBB5207742.1 hypothetical protein [Chiayiivirga flava]
MIRVRLLALALAGATLPAPNASAEFVETRGDAVGIESGVPLYTEHHVVRRERGVARERIVLYRCPDGRAFGRKTLDYGDTPATPAFRMEDAHVGYVEGARHADDGLVAFFGFAADGAPAEVAIPRGPSLVVDAGFDEFIRSRWDALQAGETLTIDFLVPSRGKAYAFELVKLREQTLQGMPASVFRLSLDGLLGWFASDIDVAYRNSDRRLMRFEGLTSVRVDRRANLPARIDFPLDAERVVTDERWRALRDEPLTDCPPAMP